MKKQQLSLTHIVFGAVMAAMVYVVTLFRFPFLGSKVHLANAVCLLSGMLLGPVPGGVAAGLGSALYDAFTGYDVINVLITFVSKFAMAWVCGRLLGSTVVSLRRADRTVIASIVGALTYVLLYMLKTFIYQRYVYAFPMDAVGATLVSKLIPSLINALAAVIAAPVFYHAVVPALKASGLLRRLQSPEA